MGKHNVFLWPNSIMSNMGIFFALIGLFLLVASSSVTCLQPINAEGKQSTLKHGVTEYKSYSLPNGGQMQNKFLQKVLGTSLNDCAVGCLDHAKKMTGKDVTAAANLKLHRELAQLHIKANEKGLGPAVAANALTTPKTTTSTGADHVEDITAPVPIIAHTNNAMPIIAPTDCPRCMSPVTVKKQTGSQSAKFLLLPSRITATSDCDVHSRERTGSGQIRAHVPLNAAAIAPYSDVALSSGVEHAQSIDNGGAVSGGDHAGEENQLNDDDHISAISNVMYTRRALGVQGKGRASSPSSYSPSTAASSVDHDKARAFHVDYSGPRTHPPRNN